MSTAVARSECTTVPAGTCGGVPRWRRVGVLGGMGPAATVDFYAKLVEETAATRDQEHLPIVVWADPTVPDRSAHLLGDGPDPGPALRAGIRGLVAAGCEVLAVPCNTAHAYVAELAAAEGIELVHLVEVAANYLASLGVARVGLLATTGTVISGLYGDALAERGVDLLVPAPADQELVMEAIGVVKAGRASGRVAEELAAVGSRLVNRGAQTLVAGCTEIVLVLDPAELPGTIVDPARLLARVVVERARATDLGGQGDSALLD